MRHIYAQLNITIGNLNYIDITGADATMYRDLQDSDLGALMKLSNNPGAQQNAVNLFFVHTIVGGVLQGYIILGESAGLPGNPFLGTTGSGVAVTTADFPNGLNDISDTWAHEMGHWFGLFHPTESGGTSFDPLPDTPECHIERDTNGDGIMEPSECVGYGADNVMFWTSVSSIPHGVLTPNQQYFMLRNPVVITTAIPGPGTLEFSSPSFTVNEGCAEAIITVNRTNGGTGAASVDFATTNGTSFTPCNRLSGTAGQNCDFSYATGTLNFLAGDTSKTFSVLISKTAYAEGPLTVNLALSNPTGGGATLGAQSTDTLTIQDDATIPTNSQPMDDAGTFVCQTYHDFLARQGDAGGQTYWTSQITMCGANQTCINNQRIAVSNAFFFELEYQQTGSYVYRLYRAAFGNTQPFPNSDNSNPTEAAKFPAYAVFLPDRARLIGSSNLAADQLALATLFVQRAAFVAMYPVSQTGSQFISAVLQTIQTADGADLSSQAGNLLTVYNNAGGGSAGQGAVMYRLANDDGSGANGGINNRAFIDAEYNRAFVTTQYFGYLRRDGDIGGLLFWLGQVNSAPLRDTTKQHAMVCSFITSNEYQNRFSALVTHTNAECPQ